MTGRVPVPDYLIGPCLGVPIVANPTHDHHFLLVRSPDRTAGEMLPTCHRCRREEQRYGTLCSLGCSLAILFASLRLAYNHFRCSSHQATCMEILLPGIYLMISLL